MKPAQKGPPKVAQLAQAGVLRQDLPDRATKLPDFGARPPVLGPVTSFAAEPTSRIVSVALDLIDPSPYQNRSKIDEKHVAELAASIDREELLQPIVLRPKHPDRYELVAGEHRFEAHKLLGRESIFAIVRDLDNVRASRAVFFDNYLHKKLSDFELYTGFRVLMDNDPKLTLRGIERETGLAKSTVGRIMMFEKLPSRAIEALRRNPDGISCGVAETLAALTNDRSQDIVSRGVEMVTEGKMLGTQVAAWVKRELLGNTEDRQWKMVTDDAGTLLCKLRVADGRITVRPERQFPIDRLEEAIFQTVRAMSHSDSQEAQGGAPDSSAPSKPSAPPATTPSTGGAGVDDAAAPTPSSGQESHG